jgi:molybdopterin-guanine dinucleotide biosynthesis protein A
MKKHEKHAKLTRPEIGFFGRNEIAFLGAPCGLIKTLVDKIIEKLPENLPVTYVDADHGNEESTLASNTFQDKISYRRLEKKSISTFDQKFLLADQDMILVNGNHFEAKSQIVIIHANKKESLKKRIAQLTNIKAVVLDEGVENIYDWLEIPAEIPVFKINEIGKIVNLVLSEIKTPPLKALILTGGKSTRMGADKSQLNYHGKSQHEYLKEALERLGMPTYISCREDQKENFENTITDKFVGLGPYGAILSAFQFDPNAAWLVVACDLPLLKKEDFEFLKSKRNFSKMATACFNPETNFPDPLFTIWEPKVYQTLLSYLSIGYSCPRKVLINSDTEVIHLPRPEILTNTNTPEERAAVLGKITSEF